MVDSLQNRLVAAALPRIGIPAAKGGAGRSVCSPDPTRAANRLLRRLVLGSRSCLPWSLGPSTPWPKWALPMGLGSAALLAALLWSGLSPWWAVLWPGVCLIAQWASLAAHHEARRQALAIRRRLRHTGSVAPLDAELSEYLRRVPEDPAARYLLAMARLESSRPLEALLQLATLRDRYPTSGEVVVLGAIACAQLHRPGQAGRLLSALNPESAHPWWADLVRFAHACGSAAPGAAGDWLESNLTS